MTACVVDGCTRNVYGAYEMCSRHLSAFLDGRLLPRSQSRAPAARSRPAPPIPSEPIQEVPMSEPETICEVPDCQNPVMVSGFGHKMKICKQHHLERLAQKRAEKKAERERFAARITEGARASDSAPVEAAAPPSPTSEPPAAPEPETALAAQAVADLAPGALATLIRDALAAHPDAVKLRVTGLKVEFVGELELTQEQRHD